MELKATIDKKDFFNRLIKNKCKFKKSVNLYPIYCDGIFFVGQLKNFKEVDVFKIDKIEANIIKTTLNIFQVEEINITLD